jgi:hypothetical protein
MVPRCATTVGGPPVFLWQPLYGNWGSRSYVWSFSHGSRLPQSCRIGTRPWPAAPGYRFRESVARGGALAPASPVTARTGSTTRGSNPRSPRLMEPVEIGHVDQEA